MATILADRVQETTATTGTGTLALAGAVAQYQSFASGIGNGNTTYYALLDGNGVQWEVGIGVYTTSGSTLTRATILASSNGGSAITLSASVHTVFCDVAASLATLLLSVLTAVGVGLVQNNGTVSLGTIAASSLMGNGQTIGAVPTGIAVGSGLSLSGNILSATGTTGVTTIVAGTGLSGGTITSSGTISLGTLSADSLFGNSGTIGAIGSSIAIGANLTLSGGTISAANSSPTTIIAGSGLSGGTISTSGTISLSNITADTLLGNSGIASATPTAIAIGTNLTLSGGTLNASAGGGSGIGTLVAGGISGTASLEAIPNLPIITGLPTLGSWINQGGSASASQNTNGPLTLTMVPISFTNIRVNYKSLPGSGPWTLVANFSMLGQSASNAPTFGIAMTDGTKVAIFVGGTSRPQSTVVAGVDIWTNITTAATFNAVSITLAPPQSTVWQKIIFNGTSTYTFDISLDGFNFIQLGTLTQTQLQQTPTGIGLGVEEFGGGGTDGVGPYYMSLNYWNGV